MKKMPLPQAILIIVLSTLLITGGSYSLLQHFTKVKNNNITTIIQTSPEKEALKTDFFMEALDLCEEVPHSFASFNIKEAEQTIKSFPIIKEVEIRPYKNHALLIDYEIKHPIAYLGNFENTGIDREGRLVPISPFMKRKRLPEIYLKEDELPKNLWEERLQNQGIQIAFQIMDILFESGLKEHFWLKQIDVASAFSESYGKREIVLIIESAEEKLTHIVRLHAKEYEQCLHNYLALKKEMPGESDPKIFDLRIPRLAFVK